MDCFPVGADCRGQRPGKDLTLDREEEIWHELVQAGIGGRTIAEAKSALTLPEFFSWCRYISKYGTLHMGMRVDRAVARALANYFGAHSNNKKYTLNDFSPYDAEIERSTPIEDQIDRALANFSRAK